MVSDPSARQILSTNPAGKAQTNAVMIEIFELNHAKTPWLAEISKTIATNRYVE
jgi:hypothetical protein